MENGDLKIRVVFIGSDPILEDLLRSDPGIEWIGSCASLKLFESFIRAAEPALMVLDLSIPKFDPFVLIERLGSRVPLLIFVAPDGSSAVRAFEYSAVDYLVKPLEPGRVRTAIA